MSKSDFFVSVDWGTTNLRLRLVDISHQKILQTVHSAQGVQSVWRSWQAQSEVSRAAFFATVIKEHLKRIRPPKNASISEFPIVVSGMASSSIGWQELPYSSVPFVTKKDELMSARLGGNTLITNEVWLISGLQKSGDVMRGEEVQVVGLMEAGRDLPNDYLLLLPGTHSKHISVSGDTIRDFHTYLTGELFQLLRSQSVLQHAMPKDQNFDWNESSFLQGVKVARNQGIAQGLFPVRALSLQGDLPPEQAYHYLSGLLIGAEIENISPSKSVVLAAPESLLTAYRTALINRGIKQLTVLAEEQVAELAVWGQLAFLRKQR